MCAQVASDILHGYWYKNGVSLAGVAVNPNPNRTLSLQSYDGWVVPNSIDPDPSSDYVALAMRAVNRILGQRTQLGPPTGRYNCHGLVFASRRTNIPPINMPDAVDVDDLLGRDQYELVDSVPQVGDVAIYRGSNRDIVHSGFVSQIQTVGKTPVIFVWSMWGGVGEFEHQWNAHPYGDCRLECWRLKR